MSRFRATMASPFPRPPLHLHSPILQAQNRKLPLAAPNATAAPPSRRQRIGELLSPPTASRSVPHHEEQKALIQFEDSFTEWGAALVFSGSGLRPPPSSLAVIHCASLQFLPITASTLNRPRRPWSPSPARLRPPRLPTTALVRSPHLPSAHGSASSPPSPLRRRRTFLPLRSAATVQFRLRRHHPLDHFSTSVPFQPSPPPLRHSPAGDERSSGRHPSSSVRSPLCSLCLFLLCVI